MIRIDNRTRDALVKDYGLWYGENGISRTYTHKPKYYLCETKRNKTALKDYYQKIGLDPKDVDRACSVK